jgi:hypothetical protein
MSCELLRALQMLARPWAREFTQPESEWLHQHFECCPSCAAWWQQEQAWDQQLQQAMTNVAVPADLMGRIHERLRQEKRYQLRPKVLRLALAALVLLAVTVSLSWYTSFLVRPLDLAALTGPIPLPENIGSETVAALLEEHGISLPDELRRRWDFRHLKAIYYTYEQGRWLCNLEFRRDDASAHVVVKLIPRRWCRPDQLEEFRHRPELPCWASKKAGPMWHSSLVSQGTSPAFTRKAIPQVS